NRGAFAHELRVHGGVEPMRGVWSCGPTERRENEFLGGARRDSAPNDNMVGLRLSAQGLADLLRYTTQSRDVRLSTRLARRADADQREIGGGDRVLRGRRCSQAIRRDGLREQV